LIFFVYFFASRQKSEWVWVKPNQKKIIIDFLRFNYLLFADRVHTNYPEFYRRGQNKKQNA
jgi:hypothetical protein